MSRDDALSFGEYIRTLRLSRQLTLVKAAQRLGLRPQRLCDIESGRRFQKNVPIEFISDIAAKYGVSFAEVAGAAKNAIKKDRTITEIVDEIEPALRFAEMMAENLHELTKQYPPEAERAAALVHKQVTDCRVLFGLLRTQVTKGPRLLKNG